MILKLPSASSINRCRFLLVTGSQPFGDGCHPAKNNDTIRTPTLPVTSSCAEQVTKWALMHLLFVNGEYLRDQITQTVKHPLDSLFPKEHSSLVGVNICADLPRKSRAQRSTQAIHGRSLLRVLPSLSEHSISAQSVAT